MSNTDRIKAIGLPPEAMLHVTQLCNSVRLATEDVELREAVAQANGFAVGLRVGTTISKTQEAQLFQLFDEVADRTKEQSATTSASQQDLADADKNPADVADAAPRDTGLTLGISESCKEALARYSRAREAYVSLSPATDPGTTRKITHDYQAALEALGYQVIADVEFQGLKV
ncbi:hypothetical protein EFK68_03625 [Pseudomonas aeruginosa]|nr:hypothetical protein [Pseudomonas aeruginosa]RNF58478.1 hypothetical protein EFK68_03625 [Pseudomonas aeruginosa]HCA5866497.1 hypothetical protein [Pseudomonas aeruginosa]HCA7376614.1 hypothetical protein [Pseudomonas aeruginosa]HCA7774848.1 hypothetical protein [Pseudomonas aeruginosa]